VPIYEYKCSKGHVFESIQSMSDDPISECEVCGAPVERVFHPVAVHFKGSGFYTTDYASKKTAPSDGKPEGGDKAAGTEKKKSDGKSESKSDPGAKAGAGSD
jgi:putative FmdB family regulatory protein